MFRVEFNGNLSKADEGKISGAPLVSPQTRASGTTSRGFQKFADNDWERKRESSDWAWNCFESPRTGWAADPSAH